MNPTKNNRQTCCFQILAKDNNLAHKLAPLLNANNTNEDEGNNWQRAASKFETQSLRDMLCHDTIESVHNKQIKNIGSAKETRIVMNNDAEALKKEIKNLQVKIVELRKRMPPHDPTMAMMVEMDELEMKQDDLKAALSALMEKSQ